MNDHDYIKANMQSVKAIDRNLFRRLERWESDINLGDPDKDFAKGEKLIAAMEKCFDKAGWDWCKDTFIWFKHPVHKLLVQALAKYHTHLEDNTLMTGDAEVELQDRIEEAIAILAGAQACAEGGCGMTSHQDQQRPPPSAQAKIIERLKKLFALGTSSNQHEAEAALAMANRLMTEHQINAMDIDLSDAGAVGREDLELDGGRQSLWLVGLANHAATLYDAKALYYSSAKGPNLKILFIGTPTDIAVAKMTFHHLHGSWKSIVKTDQRQVYPLATRGFRRSHGQGFAFAIGKRVSQLIAERRATVKSATGKDLVVVKDAAVSEFLSSLTILKGRGAPAADRAGFNAGYQRGKDIPLHGGLDSGSDKPLMIGADKP